MSKVNPFRPNSIVPPGMFAGRWNEVLRLESGLSQTKAGNPTHFMLTGERGIGKTSLQHYIRWVALGEINGPSDHEFRFLVVDIDIDAKTTQFGLIRRIERCLKRELGKTDPARSFLSSAWEFIQRVEALGVRINEAPDIDSEMLLDELSYSLSETTRTLCIADASTSVFESSYDGILLLIDEADNASQTLDLGVFLKRLLERLQRNQCEKVMVILAGLPELENILIQSHPSSLRLFETLHLKRLTSDEVNEVINRCLHEAQRANGTTTTIEKAARETLVLLAEGFPHFIQQFGSSAFALDTDDNIDVTDVMNGAFGTSSYGGALKLIGDRYYRNDFYNKIQKDSYRQVLRIMANEDDPWISKKAIREKFKGNDGILDNAIKALRTRHIILSKEGVRGIYGLQHRGFALWIKLYATPRNVLAETLERLRQHDDNERNS